VSDYSKKDIAIAKNLAKNFGAEWKSKCLQCGEGYSWNYKINPYCNKCRAIKKFKMTMGELKL